MPSVTDTNVTPRSLSALTVSRTWRVLRPNRSSFHTTTVSPARTYSMRAASPGRSSRAPDMMSENVLVTNARAATLGLGVTHKQNNTRCETTISETDY
jgi:hypothetical protein